jgi:hypothetical protein
MSKNTKPEAARDDQEGAGTIMAELQEQLATLTAERDTLAAQLAEAHAKLQAAAAPAKSTHAGKGTHVRVCSKAPGGSHRRAGRVWTTQPQDVPLAELSTEQLAQLRTCPLTIVIDL